MIALDKNISLYSYSWEKRNDVTLLVKNSEYPYVHTRYDFLQRVAYITGDDRSMGIKAIPFSQLDPESLKFFRDQLVEKGGKPPALPAEPVDAKAEPSETWVRLGDMAVAQVGVYPAIQRKLTHIFNLASRQMTPISENLKTGKEDAAAPVGFDDLPAATLEKALEEFAKAGGKAGESFVLRGVTRLNK